jgi:AraC-like DNA-binding protein
MTVDDEKLTSGASAGPTVMAAMVAGNLAAAGAYGLPAAELAARAGLAEAELGDPDGRVPLSSYVRLLSAIDADPRAEGFGFWLGETVSVRVLGVVGFAMQHAPDVRTAFRCLDRFRVLLNDQVSPSIEETAEHVVFRQVEPPPLARLAAVGVAGPVGTLTLLRELTGLDRGRPVAVEAAFQHAAPARLDRYRASLGCPVAFDAPETRLAIHREVFDLPLRRPDAGLFAYLERHALELQARLSDRQTLSARVREAVVSRLSEGEPSPAALARGLGMSERTLQRRLRDEGTSFGALLDEARAELARLYLDDERLAIFEVAYLLGYSEPSAFNRAFRRWTGASPREYRRG